MSIMGSVALQGFVAPGAIQICIHKISILTIKFVNLNISLAIFPLSVNIELYLTFP